MCGLFFPKGGGTFWSLGAKLEVNSLVGNKDLLLSGGEGGSAYKAGYLGLFAITSLPL